MAELRPHRAELQPVIASIQLFRVAFDRFHCDGRVQPDRFEQRRVFAPAASEFFANLRRKPTQNELRAAKSGAIARERASIRSFACEFARPSTATRSLLFEVRSVPRSADAAPSADSSEARSPAITATQ